jgi:hypothetical protein
MKVIHLERCSGGLSACTQGACLLNFLIFVRGIISVQLVLGTMQKHLVMGLTGAFCRTLMSTFLPHTKIKIINGAASDTLFIIVACARSE